MTPPPTAPRPPAVVRPAAGGQSWSLVSARPGDHVSLMPGQLYFGSKAATVRTLLGSCVAVTLWHPHKRIGGMCHYLLPRRGGPVPDQPEGRFGEEALAMMVRMLRMAGTEPHEYEAQLYGGADTQSGATGARTGIGERNIELGWELIEQHGFMLQAVDVGDDVPRMVKLDMASGEVDMRRGQPMGRGG